MALSTKTMRGLIRKYGMRAFEKVVIYPDDVTPVYEPLFIRPTEVPSGTLVDGCYWHDDDNHTLAWYNGTANVEAVHTGAVAQTLAGNITLSGTLNVTGATAIAGATNYKKQVTDTAGAFATPIVLTTAQSGRVLLLDDAAGLDFTLPAIGASDVGTWFRFVCTVSCTSNSYRITAGAADLLKGAVTMVDFDAAYTAPQAVFIEPDGSDDLIMTMNGSTTGGKIGTDVEFLAISATEWFVSGIVGADGTIATPFS